MSELIEENDMLKKLSEDILETIEREDKEYFFKHNGYYVERNVPASKFKK